MTRHVVGTFVDVRVPGLVFGGDPIEPRLHVAPGGRVGILLDADPRGGVFYEHGAERFFEAGVLDDVRDHGGDLVQPAPVSRDFDRPVHSEDSGPGAFQRMTVRYSCSKPSTQ